MLFRCVKMGVLVEGESRGRVLLRMPDKKGRDAMVGESALVVVRRLSLLLYH
jgi:hypothetical protein